MNKIEYIGPSFWHGRESNTCTRCKYLQCSLVESGRDPIYEHTCMHPSILAGEQGEVIERDEFTPETAAWCPVTTEKSRVVGRASPKRIVKMDQFGE